jgi:hypothetical protein
MKTLGRILIILIAALAVSGATYALSQTTAVTTLVGQPMDLGESEGRSGPPDFSSGQGELPGEARGGDREGRSGSWETVGRNLLQIAAIVAAVQIMWSSGRWIKRTAASFTRKDRLSPSRR